MLTGSQSRLQASAPEAFLGRIFGILGTAMGVFMLVGTLVAGTVSKTLGVIPVLNIQAAGKLLAGVLTLALLPRMMHPPPASRWDDDRRKSSRPPLETSRPRRLARPGSVHSARRFLVAAWAHGASQRYPQDGRREGGTLNMIATFWVPA